MSNASNGSDPRNNGADSTEAAFLAAYEEHADGLFRFLVMKTSNREMAQDLLQETFAKTWDYCREGKEIGHWKQFLFRTAYNMVVDFYRKKKSSSLDELLDNGFTVVAEDAKVETEAELAEVRAAISELPDTYRDIILLRYTEDLTPGEIAEIMDVTENVVSVRIHRGVQKLREIMEAAGVQQARRKASV